MASKAVFLDRDNTVIEDPGYISDPQVVKLLPGVELAIKSLAQAGYKIVIVSNQSGVARGLLTEEMLERIHTELQRQLGTHGAHLDGIYYCPFHPEGTVEQYTKDSDLRKPKPGMLLKAAEDMDLDLPASWMVGDSVRDIEAGQRAGCRTVRVRVRASHHAAPGLEDDENVQADFTVRNLVDAARVILRSPAQAEEARAAQAARASAAAAANAETVEDAAAPGAATTAVLSDAAPEAACEMPSHPDGWASEEDDPSAPGDTNEASGSDDAASVGPDDAAVRREILSCVRQMARSEAVEEFSFVKLFAAIVQVLALLALFIVFYKMLNEQIPHATLWALIAIALQMMSLTLFFGVKRR
jgi:D,D-heptose 1,7-bisphosphate phosphatase